MEKTEALRVTIRARRRTVLLIAIAQAIPPDPDSPGLHRAAWLSIIRQSSCAVRSAWPDTIRPVGVEKSITRPPNRAPGGDLAMAGQVALQRGEQQWAKNRDS
jgi:hypothetical protein